MKPILKYFRPWNHGNNLIVLYIQYPYFIDILFLSHNDASYYFEYAYVIAVVSVVSNVTFNLAKRF